MKTKKGLIELSVGTIIVIVLFVVVFFSGVALVKNLFFDVENYEYTFILNGEKMSEITSCEGLWHYELIDNLIPCVVNKTIGGIGGDNINWSISPEENCENVNGTFTGLNIYNETRNQELYNNLLPLCFDMKEEDISLAWMNAIGCICQDQIGEVFMPGCKVYKCGDNLIVEEKDEK